MPLQLTVISLDFDSDSTPVTTRYSKNEITLGRSPNNDVVLDQPEVSARHLKLRIEAGKKPAHPRLFVTDLGSLNGTLLENLPLEPQVEREITSNERIIVGSYLIKPLVTSDEGQLVTATPTRSGLLTPKYEEQKMGEDVFRAATPSLGSGKQKKEDAKSAVKATKIDESFEEIEEQSFIAEIEPASPTVITEAEDEVLVITGQVDLDDITELNFEATQLFSIKGRVVHRGKPLKDVKISAGNLGAAVTAQDGNFILPRITEKASYALEATLDGFIFECDKPRGIVTGDITVTFTARKLFSLSGAILHRGKGLAGVEVVGGPLGVATTDSDGYFTFGELAEGTKFAVEPKKERFRFSAEGLKGEISQNTALDIRATKLLTISGIISHNGKPLEGVEVDGGPILGKTVTDQKGRYRFVEVPEGTEYTLSATKPGFKFSQR
jgi:pSer/pThr/pTyr-binding forkhead associated (FHA) protein